MFSEKTTFALFFANRGFFPGSLQETARREMPEVLRKLGHDVIMLDAEATRYGAVETPQEGQLYANFLKQNAGKFGGVICCLPNFGDENGAVAALRDAGVPILVQAYPDDLDKMAPALRRDAFCGKFSIMDVFCQSGIKFTALKPHTVHPSNPRFAENVTYFDKLCRTVNAVNGMVVGAFGARTTAFKTVRIDELALERNGITMEVYDLSEVFFRMNDIKPEDDKYRAKIDGLKNYSCWDGVPGDALDKLVRMGVVFDDMIDEFSLDCVAIRCWVEMEKQIGVAPCVLLSELNDRGIVAACEVDVGNAVAMYALAAATGDAVTCLDWNNNYAEEDDKCILFHCGPVPASLMAAKGHVVDHEILKNAVGPGCAYGPNVGRIKPFEMSYGSMLTQDGRLKFYLGEGRFTEDQIPEDFFGCAGVAEIDHLQDVLQTVGYQGHRHHVSVARGTVAAPVAEALDKYLGYDVTSF